MQPIADRLPLIVQTAQPIEFAGRVVAFQIEPCLAKQWKLRRGSVQVPDAGPASQAAFTDRRGESAGGHVGDGPDVIDGSRRTAAGHKHVHGPSRPFISLARTGGAGLAWSSGRWPVTGPWR